MDVDIRYHDSVRLALQRWETACGPTDARRAGTYQMQLGAMLAHLQRHGGRPPQAHVVERPAGDIWWWQFSDMVRIEYTLSEHPPAPRGWWDAIRRLARVVRRPTARVVVIRVTVELPTG